jgi:membrane protein
MGEFYKKSIGLFFDIKNLNREYTKKIFFEAASLSFYTIFTIIPLFMVVFALFTSSPFFQEYYLNLQNFIYNTLLPGKTGVITTYIETLINNASKLGMVGFFYGFIAAVLFFINFEFLMNKIFKVEKGRDLWNSISTFWTLIGFVPMALILSIYLSIKFKDVLNITHILPFLIIWFIFTIIYAITPNKKVNRRAALITAFISSVFWYIMRNIFISFVLENKIYQTIYGSLSIILLLFIWIYISWIIIVSGAYLCAFLEGKLEKNSGEDNDNNTCN